MRISSREALLGVVAGGVVLLGVTALLLRPKLDEWRELREQQAELRQQIEMDKRLVAQRATWEARLAELSEMLPEFDAGKKMDVHWLSVMDGLASRNGIKLLKQQAGQEEDQGDVSELPIECREYECDLNALVHFLFDLQSQGAMLDVRQLRIKPKGEQLLRGSFSLYCAYRRSP